MINHHTMYEKNCYTCNCLIEGVVYTSKGQSHCEKCYYQQIKDRREQYKEDMKQELSKEYPKAEKKYWE